MSAPGPTPPSADGLAERSEGFRVGVDLVTWSELDASIERLGRRFLDRMFTDHELSCAEGPRAHRNATLAARFAAKEAVVKVLRPVGARPEWRSIEVRRHPEGACDLRLHGMAERLAHEQRLARWDVSLSHHAGLAVAVVVAHGELASPCPLQGDDRDLAGENGPAGGAGRGGGAGLADIAGGQLSALIREAVPAMLSRSSEPGGGSETSRRRRGDIAGAE